MSYLALCTHQFCSAHLKDFARRAYIYISSTNKQNSKYPPLTLNFYEILFVASGSVENVQLSVKDSAIKVTWQLPQCKGNIGEIKVQYRKKGQSSWQWELTTPASSDKEVTIKGLDKGAEYEVRVVVVDINGTTHEMIGTKLAKTGTC